MPSKIHTDKNGNHFITMEWINVAKPDQITCGGNPLYACGHCGYIYGSYEIYPSVEHCPNCGAKAVLSI